MTSRWVSIGLMAALLLPLLGLVPLLAPPCPMRCAAMGLGATCPMMKASPKAQMSCCPQCAPRPAAAFLALPRLLAPAAAGTLAAPAKVSRPLAVAAVRGLIGHLDPPYRPPMA